MDDQVNNTDPQINLLLLPVSLRRLVRLVGEKRAFELCKYKGGTDIKVPGRFDPEHWLVGFVGHDGLANLVQECGTELIHLPKIDKVLQQLRHQQVHELERKGRTPTEIVCLTGYSRRQVFNIRAELAEAEGAEVLQGDLFGGAEVLVEEPVTPTTGAHNPFGLIKTP